MPPAPHVSIVVATYQRRARLERCLQRTRAAVSRPCEFVVIDGGSSDGTAAWLAQQRDVRFEIETERGGCCAAYDRGLRLARGRYVMWLNDDSYALPGSIDAAVEFLESHPARSIGMVAFYHTHQQPWNELDGHEYGGQRYGVLHVRGFPYANFGLLRRETLAAVDFLDRGYRFCGWDPDLSLKVQRLALRPVVGVPEARVYHEEHIDERKAADAGQTRTLDNARLFAKWNLPPKGTFAGARRAYAELAASLGLGSASGFEPFEVPAADP